jgi:hypothetical protein
LTIRIMSTSWIWERSQRWPNVPIRCIPRSLYESSILFHFTSSGRAAMILAITTTQPDHPISRISACGMPGLTTEIPGHALRLRSHTVSAPNSRRPYTLLTSCRECRAGNLFRTGRILLRSSWRSRTTFASSLLGSILYSASGSLFLRFWGCIFIFLLLDFLVALFGNALERF